MELEDGKCRACGEIPFEREDPDRTDMAAAVWLGGWGLFFVGFIIFLIVVVYN